MSGPNPLRWVQQRVPLLREMPLEVTGISAIAFFVALGFGIVAPVIPNFAREFGVSAFAATAVVSVFAAMRLASAPPATWMLGKFGERNVLTVGLVIVSLSSAMAGLSRTYTQLIVLRGIGGLGSTMFTVASMAMLMRVVDADHRGRAAGAWSGGFLTGGLAGPAVGGFFASISLRAPFFVYSSTLLMAAVVSWNSLRNASLSHHDAPTAKRSFAESSQELLTAVRNPAYLAAVSTNFTSGFARIGLMNSLVPLFVISVLHRSASFVSTGFLVSAIAQASLLGYAGRSADLRGRKPVMLMGMAATVIALATMGSFEVTLMYLAAMGLVGASGAFLSSAPTAVVGDITGGKPRGAVLATYQMASDFGGIVGPLVAGWLLDLSGNFDVPFTAAAAITLISFGLTLRMKESRRG